MTDFFGLCKKEWLESVLWKQMMTMDYESTLRNCGPYVRIGLEKRLITERKIMNVQLIYLAAGNSRRFGSNKLFYEIDGRPMYQHLLERLLSICGRHENWRLRVVSQYETLLHQVGELWPEVSFMERIYSPDSVKGVSYSVRAGISGVEDVLSAAPVLDPEKLSASENAPAKAVLPDAYAFFVADQPWLSEKTAEEFLMEMEAAKAPLGSVCFEGQPGNPTWFSGEFLPELLALEGDKGGRAVLRRHEVLVRWFEVKEKRELMDLDLPGQVV